MPLDSESRWRLVRQKKAKPSNPENLESKIRTLEPGDLTQVHDIYNFYIQNGVATLDIELMTLAQWKDKAAWLESLGLPFIVAESPSGEILGFAYLAPWRQKAGFKRTAENTIYLRPAAMGKRIGSRLLAELLERGKKAGIREVLAVISDQGAEASIRLHESFGFKSQGHLERVGFKLGKWIGTYLMQKSL